MRKYYFVNDQVQCFYVKVLAKLRHYRNYLNTSCQFIEQELIANVSINHFP
jgi:tRNA isopentenyl-2-thiomethyl-A-37 hydroxylase MiaE